MKLHIFGASGAGVTTLGQALATHLALPYFDSDNYFWEPTDPPFTTPRTPAARNALIRTHLAAAEAAAPKPLGAFGAEPAGAPSIVPFASLGNAEPAGAPTGWILGGSIYRWGDDVFPPFDLIVFLWLPPDIRLARLRAREQTRYGDKLQTDPIYIKHHEEFMKWAADYDHDTGIATRTLNGHEAWLKKQTSPILELRGDLTVAERLGQILAHIGKEK